MYRYRTQKLYSMIIYLQAKDSLEKWRTHNTLANVTTLKETLRKMGKTDIVESIERKPVKPRDSKQQGYHWNKVKKVKFLLGEIMSLQRKTHTNKLESHGDGRPRLTSLGQAGMYGGSGGTLSAAMAKSGRINLKNSNIIMRKAPKRKHCHR